MFKKLRNIGIGSLLTFCGVILVAVPFTASADWFVDSAASKENQGVMRQQSQYSKVQPFPFFNYSPERQRVIQLYKIRASKVSTYTVWRSNTGMIEGDCSSVGYGIPYDTSLTNPLMAIDENQTGGREAALATIGLPEPNGLYASTATSATWVMCLSDTGQIMPVYVESKVTTYPYQVEVDYDKNRAYRKGKATVTLKK